MSFNPNFSSYENPLNNPDVTYEQVLDYLENKIADVFANEVGSSLENDENCSQTTGAYTNQSLTIAPGVTVKNCNIRLSSKTTVSTNQQCSNPDLKLFTMSLERKEQLFTKICDDIKQELTSAFPDKTSFIKYFIPLMKANLMDMNSPSKFQCRQDVLGIRDQQVKITKNLTCIDNSPIVIDGSIWANIRMKCLAKKSLDTLRNNSALAKFFIFKENDDCNYDKIIVKECDGSKRTVKIKINYPSRGSGSCPYTDGQEVEEACSFGNCIISDWKPWSPCFEVNGIGKQYRTREITSYGRICPEASNLKEERNCVSGSFTGVQSEFNEEISKLPKTSNSNKPWIIILFIIFIIVSFVIYKMKSKK